jgi:hypothetical protein
MQIASNYTDLNARTIDRWVESGWEWGTPISHEEFLRAQSGDWRAQRNRNFFHTPSGIPYGEGWRRQLAMQLHPKVMFQSLWGRLKSRSDWATRIVYTHSTGKAGGVCIKRPST